MLPNPNKSKKILVVDDHPIVRKGLLQIINNEPGLQVCGEAESAQETLARIQECTPDLLLVDISIKGANGIELIKNLKGIYNIPVLMLSIHDESLYAERALRAGAKGYIMKHEAPEKVILAIKRVLSGEIYLSEKMGERLLQKFINGKEEINQSPIARLSDRELEIFRLIGQGHGTRQIAESLTLSIKTVESHRAHIKQKLKLKNAVELVHHAVKWEHSTGSSN